MCMANLAAKSKHLDPAPPSIAINKSPSLPLTPLLWAFHIGSLPARSMSETNLFARLSEEENCTSERQSGILKIK